jgi:hypothetical protein
MPLIAGTTGVAAHFKIPVQLQWEVSARVDLETVD